MFTTALICLHFTLNFSVDRDTLELYCSILITSLIIVCSLSWSQFIGLSMWISCWIIFTLAILVSGELQDLTTSSKLLTNSQDLPICVIKVLYKLQMFFAWTHSNSKCFVVSIKPHLGQLSVSVILYFFILTCVKNHCVLVWSKCFWALDFCSFSWIWLYFLRQILLSSSYS